MKWHYGFYQFCFVLSLAHDTTSCRQKAQRSSAQLAASFCVNLGRTKAFTLTNKARGLVPLHCKGVCVCVCYLIPLRICAVNWAQHNKKVK